MVGFSDSGTEFERVTSKDFTKVPLLKIRSKLDLDNLKRTLNSMPGENTVYIAEFSIKFCPRRFRCEKGAIYQIILTKGKRQFCMNLLPF